MRWLSSMSHIKDVSAAQARTDKAVEANETAFRSLMKALDEATRDGDKPLHGLADRANNDRGAQTNG